MCNIIWRIIFIGIIHRSPPERSLWTCFQQLCIFLAASLLDLLLNEAKWKIKCWKQNFTDVPERALQPQWWPRIGLTFLAWCWPPVYDYKASYRAKSRIENVVYSTHSSGEWRCDNLEVYNPPPCDFFKTWRPDQNIVYFILKANR